jgi:exopolysaccharide production protein ExoZ
MAPSPAHRGPLRWVRATLELEDASHPRLLAMEGLRGFAVFLVFLQHFGYQALQLTEPSGVVKVALGVFRSYGNQGVELFFVLSGYLIYGSLVARQTRFLPFMRRRIRRIYPAFLVAFGLYFCAVLAGPTSDRIPSEPLALTWYLLSNLLLLPGIFPLPELMAVAWSLSYEVTFYLICGLIAARFTLFRAAPARRIAGIQLIAAVFITASWFLPWLPTRMIPFFAGMLLAEGVGTSVMVVPGWLGLTAPAIALLVTHTLPISGLFQELIHAIAFFLLCASCFAGTAAASVFSWTPARLLGNMSYSYYLLHGLAVATIAAAYPRFLAAPAPAWQVVASLPAVFAVSLVPTFALFALVERPLSLRPRAAAAVRWTAASK